MAFVLLFATPAAAQFAPETLHAAGHTDHPLPLPYFDARFEAGEVRAAVRAQIERARSEVERNARALDRLRLASDVPAVVIDEDELFGTPHFVRSTRAFLTAPTEGGTNDTRRIATDFVARYPHLFEVTPGELAAARVRRDFVTKHNGMRHLTLQQEIGGLELFGCQLKASVTARGELINVSSTMLPLARRPLALPEATLPAARAIRIAAQDTGLALASEPEPTGSAAGRTQRQTWRTPGELRADVELVTQLVAFPRSRSEIRPAWSLTIAEPGLGNTYEYLVDATNGDVLRRWNRLHFFGGTQPISMRVYTSDSPAPGSPGNATPNDFQFPFVPRSLVTITPGEVAASSPNHWIDDGGNETLGNNVDAHTDLNADNAPDLPRPQGAPARTFDFALDTTQAPSTYRSAAVTQLFYLCNRYHDKLYSLGFDEAAGNYQASNFGLGGVQGDRVLAQAQDGQGTDNANFNTTGTDGSEGRMQMYVFSFPTPDRDGALDADIVFHEYSHGLSIRLHDGMVFGEQSGGMGEGWGDFIGISMNTEATDDPNANYCTGGYSTLHFLQPTYVDNYYFGIRRFPYSTDLNVNPQTYADIDPAQQSYPPAIPRSPVISNTADQVHNVGEVWCNTLFECRAQLWNTLGFAANDVMLQLVVDGMKLSPLNPNFLQARDAILAADLATFGGAHSSELWAGFAKRGLGFSATSPSGSTTTGVVEAFDVPVLILFAYPNGIPQQLAPGASTTFQVAVTGIGTTNPVPGSGELHYSINGGAFASVPMTPTGPNQYDATLPALSCFDVVRFYVASDASTGVGTDPASAPTAFRSAQAFTGVSALFTDDFQANFGWTASVVGASSGQWQRGVPVDDPAWAYDPAADADGSGSCYLTQNTLGNTDVDGGSVLLVSPAIDMLGAQAVRIAYDYYLTLTVEDGVDRLLVEISSSGTSGPWTEIARHDTNGANAWRHHEVDSGTLLGLGIPLTTDMRLRFTANDSGTASIVESGVDGLRVEELECTGESPSAFCFGDGSLATACPCALPDTVPNPSGASDAGCANSFHLGGGRLTISGAVNPDTIVLTASDLSTIGFTFFFFGTGIDAAGFAVGDGVRCVDGTLIRFGSQNAVGGTAMYPNPGLGLTTPVSTIGSTPPGSGLVGHYQALYRNAVAGFCSPGTVNLTNAYRIPWN
ncbi:MAG: extracellular metalloproteinase [Planctomycetota bacterium]